MLLLNLDLQLLLHTAALCALQIGLSSESSVPSAHPILSAITAAIVRLMLISTDDFYDRRCVDEVQPAALTGFGGGQFPAVACYTFTSIAYRFKAVAVCYC